MQIAGIIAEYDPFHKGHAWQIAEARRMGAQAVVCAVSPDVVQRGGFALLPQAVRVRAALLAGADLVVEIPAPYAASSAEQFAAAGVALLAGLGCVDTLVFGSETGDAVPLLETARLLERSDFAPLLKQQLAGGRPFALARARAAAQLDEKAAACLERPNDLLGVEYCKAILRQNAALRPLAIPRQGAGHQQPPKGGFASASWLRDKGLDHWKDYVPEEAMELYRESVEKGELLCRRSADIAVLSRLRAMIAVDFAGVRGVNEGLEHRLSAAVAKAGSLEELYSLLKCRRYAHSRLRRLVLDAALRVPADLPALPPYLRLVGASDTGVRLLRRTAPALPMSTSLARLASSSAEAERVAALHSAAQDLSALCREIPQPMAGAWRMPFLRQNAAQTAANDALI